MGDAAERALSALFAAMADYCGRHSIGGRGFHEFAAPEGLRVELNATGEEQKNVPPFHAAIYNEGGWPIAVIHPYGGGIINMGWGDNPAWTEDRLIKLFSEESQEP